MQISPMIFNHRHSNNSLKGSGFLGAACLLLWVVSPVMMAQEDVSRTQCVEGVVSVHCGSAPSATFDSQDRLWVTFVQDQHVYVSRSDDRGVTYSTPVKVNAEPEDAEFNGENRPKVIVTKDGTMLLSWTLKTSPRFTGEIRFTRSTDYGKTFEDVRTINDDQLFAGHRFESMFLTESGHLYLTWIDKRDLEASIEKDEDYVGAAVYGVVSDDLGETFKANFRVANHSCECCRIAMAPRGDEGVAILWRQVFGEDVRDHAVAYLDPQGNVTNVQRATYDEWHINACPHHGPDMIASDTPDEYHITWFTNGSVNQGIYYARHSYSSGETVQQVLVDDQPGAGHPNLAQHDGTLYLVWKGFDGMSTKLHLTQSIDDGKNWSERATLLQTQSGSDHPLLIKHDEGVYLSWHTQELGYIFQEISDAS